MKIRKYQSQDKQAVRKICADTGLQGKPIDPVFSDREIFSSVITDYYLDHEPEHAWVVEDQGKVVGYLLGCTNTKRFERIMATKIIPTTIAKTLKRCFIDGKYNNHQNTKKFLKWAATKAMFEMVEHPHDAPAHLHINLAQGYRSRRLGLDLLTNYENMLRENGINKYFGEVFSSESRRQEELYKRIGFEIFDKKPTTIFQNTLENKIYMMCITKSLTPEATPST
ncbi:GNAT family N-acetyltransferase [Nanoarchaeota archaeon]